VRARARLQVRKYREDNNLAVSMFDRSLNPTRKQLQNLVASVRREDITDDAQADLERWAARLAGAGEAVYMLRRKAYVRPRARVCSRALPLLTSIAARRCGRPNRPFLFCLLTKFMHHIITRYGASGPLLMDATYKTMSHELALFHLMAIDNMGKAQACGMFLAEREESGVLVEALRWFVLVSGTLRPDVVVLDKSPAELAAVNVIFRDVRVIWCKFHRQQAWHRSASGGALGARASRLTPARCAGRYLLVTKSLKTKTARSRVQELWSSVANADTKEAMEAAYAALAGAAEITQTLKAYFDKEWWKYRERWCRALLTDVRHLETMTTNLLEAHHHGIKKRIDMCNLLRRTQRGATRGHGALTRPPGGYAPGNPARVMQLLLDDHHVRVTEYVHAQADQFGAAYARLGVLPPVVADTARLFGPRPRRIAEAIERHAGDPAVIDWVQSGGRDLEQGPGGTLFMRSFNVDRRYTIGPDGWCSCPHAVTMICCCKHMAALAMLRGSAGQVPLHPRLVFDELLVARHADSPQAQLRHQRLQLGAESLAAPDVMPNCEQRFPLWRAVQERAAAEAVRMASLVTAQGVAPPAPAAQAPPPPPPPPAAADGLDNAPPPADDPDDGAEPDAAATISGVVAVRQLSKQMSNAVAWLQHVEALPLPRFERLQAALAPFTESAGSMRAEYSLPVSGKPGRRLRRAVTGATRPRGRPPRPVAAAGRVPQRGRVRDAAAADLLARRPEKRICRGGCTGCDAPNMWAADEALVRCAACDRQCHVRCVGQQPAGWRCSECDVSAESA
jgi:hypothetical protein